MKEEKQMSNVFVPIEFLTMCQDEDGVGCKECDRKYNICNSVWDCPFNIEDEFPPSDI